MSPEASWLVMGAFVGLPTFIVGCALRMAGLASRAEERLARVLVYKLCLECRHKYDPKVIDGTGHDLANPHFEEVKQCPACLYHANKTVEIDISTTSLAEIQAIGRERLQAANGSSLDSQPQGIVFSAPAAHSETV
jgi:hypothetical protein